MHYLADLDAYYNRERNVPGSHKRDVVDLAHARWATGTAVTALDLCASAIGRALCKHQGKTELDLGDFDQTTRRSNRKQQQLQQRLQQLPPPALQWINGVFVDPAFEQLKEARHALTHRTLPRHLFTGPQRLKLNVGENEVSVADLVVQARELATTHVVALLRLLPEL